MMKILQSLVESNNKIKAAIGELKKHKYLINPLIPDAHYSRRNETSGN